MVPEDNQYLVKKVIAKQKSLLVRDKLGRTWKTTVSDYLRSVNKPELIKGIMEYKVVFKGWEETKYHEWVEDEDLSPYWIRKFNEVQG